MLERFREEVLPGLSAGAARAEVRGVAACSWAPGRYDVFVVGGDGGLHHIWAADGPWSAWEDLGQPPGGLTSRPAAVSWGPERIDVFARGADNALWHKFYDGYWSDWESLGGILTSAPAVATWGPGRLHVFCRGTDNGLHHLDYFGVWRPWEALGGFLASAPAVAAWDNRRLDVFVRGGDNALWRRSWEGDRWSEWGTLNGIIAGPPTVVARGPGQLDVFVPVPAGVLCRRHHVAGIGWTEWMATERHADAEVTALAPEFDRLDLFTTRADGTVVRLSGDVDILDRLAAGVLPPVPGGRPAAEARGMVACSWEPGRIDLFAVAGDRRLRHAWITGSWNGWEDLGQPPCGLTSRPAAVCMSPGRIDVFARGGDNALWHLWYQGRWSNWEVLGGILTSAPAAATWGPGRLDVFVRGTDQGLHQRYWDGVQWSGWIAMGGILTSAPAVASWGPNRLDVFVRGTDNSLCHRFFEGTWSDWQSLGGTITSDLIAVAPRPGQLDVLVGNTAGKLSRRRFDLGVWKDWFHSAHPAGGQVTAVSWSPGRLDLFSTRADEATLRFQGQEIRRLGPPNTAGLTAVDAKMLCTYSVEAQQGIGALAWLVGDVFGVGMAALVQPWDNDGRLAMLVYQGDERGTLRLRFRCDDMGQGAGNIGWLIGDIDGDGRDEIVQLWDNGGRLGIIVYGAPAANAGVVVQQCVEDIGQGSGRIRWLIGDIDGDGRKEIVHLWNNGGKLAVLAYGTDASGRLMLKVRMDDSGHGAGALLFMLADVNGDGRDELVHVWDGGGLCINVYGWSGQSMPALSSSTNLGHGTGYVALLTGDINGDGRAELVQLWDAQDRLGTIVYGFNSEAQPRVLWSGTHPSEGPRGRWLISDVNGDGRAELVQAWSGGSSEAPRLGLNLWTSDAFGVVSLAFGNRDMGQGPDALAFRLGDFNGDGRIELLQLWKGPAGLGLNLYRACARHFPAVSDEEKLNLLTAHAPRVWLHPNELYMPSSVEWAFPQLVRCRYADRSGYWLQTRNPLLHDSDNSLPLFRGNLGTAPVYAFWVDKGDVVDLVYFFFYPYNRGKNVAGTVFGNHVGDWEHITVRLLWLWDRAEKRRKLVPHQFCASMHDMQTNLDWRDTPTHLGTHPVIYAAEGSHGCWMEAGAHVYHAALGLTDVCAAGQAWDTWTSVMPFDFSNRRSLIGHGWPAWMSNNYPDPGTGDPMVPGNGPIYRWGNKKGTAGFLDHRILEDGPTGPIDKGVWGPYNFE